MAENLKAFESLKENENASLSSKEKADLRKISPDDIKSQKEKVWDKSFVVDGKSMKLKDIVKNLVFDEEGEKAELKINGKKVAIGWESELWAAIQVYAIAHNKTIGRAWIDGKVGRDTVKWLQSTQNAVKAAEKSKKNPETDPQSKELIGWEALVNQPFWKYIKPEKNIKLLEERGIMNPQTGCLTPTNKSSYIKDKKLKFDYKFGWSTLKVEVPVNENKYHEIDPKKVADAIIKSTINKQNEHKTEQKNQTVEAGINNFREKDITDPLIKKWALSKKIDFTCDAGKNGKVVVRDKDFKKLVNDGNKTGWFIINNTDLLTNWKFDTVKFNKIIANKCHAEAMKAVKLEIDGTAQSFWKASEQTSISKIDDRIKQCKDLKTEIDSLGYASELADKKSMVEKKRMSFEVQKDYLSMKDKIKEATNNVKNLMKGVWLDKFDEKFEVALKEIKKCIAVTKKDESHYDLKYNNVARLKFQKAGKKEEYNTMIAELIAPISKRLITFNHLNK